MAKPDFDPNDSVGFWDLINRQDWAICQRVQLGMQTRCITPDTTRRWKTSALTNVVT